MNAEHREAEINAILERIADNIRDGMPPGWTFALVVMPPPFADGTAASMMIATSPRDLTAFVLKRVLEQLADNPPADL